MDYTILSVPYSEKANFLKSPNTYFDNKRKFCAIRTDCLPSIDGRWKILGVMAPDFTIISATPPNELPEADTLSLTDSAENVSNETEQYWILNVPFVDKDQAKKVGAKWDMSLKLWTWFGSLKNMPQILQSFEPKEATLAFIANDTYINPGNIHINTKSFGLPDDFVILDTETTGFAGTDEVVELGITDLQGNEIYHSFFHPERPMGYGAAKVTGISAAALSKEPYFKNEWDKIKAIINNRQIMAFNTKFDKRLMIQTAQRYQLDGAELMFANCLDALDIVKKYHGSSLKLCEACKKVGITDEQKHRATYDCLWVALLLDKLSKLNENERIAILQ